MLVFKSNRHLKIIVKTSIRYQPSITVEVENGKMVIRLMFLAEEIPSNKKRGLTEAQQTN